MISRLSLLALVVGFSVSGCAVVERVNPFAREADAPQPAETEVAETPLDPAGLGAAIDAADADAASVEAAAAPDPTLPPPVGAGSVLGQTVVSLGDPSIGGMWLKTPLVDTEQPGQVRYRGAVVAVTLQPLDAEIGAGSQISVRAMQALGASLTDLVEVTVERT